MPWVRSGIAEVEIDGAVKAAVRLLRYFDPAKEMMIADLIAARWQDFCSGARYLRKHPDVFNDYGRSHQTAAIAALRGFVTFAVWRTVFDGSEYIWSKYASHVELRSNAKACCAQSRPLDGLVLPREERYQLPLKDCDREWCSCRWLERPDIQ